MPAPVLAPQPPRSETRFDAPPPAAMPPDVLPVLHMLRGTAASLPPRAIRLRRARRVSAAITGTTVAVAVAVGVAVGLGGPLVSPVQPAASAQAGGADATGGAATNDGTAAGGTAFGGRGRGDAVDNGRGFGGRGGDGSGTGRR